MDQEIHYKLPNFEYEWGEAERYPFFAKRGINKWIEIAKSGKPVKVNSKTVANINNTDAADPNAFDSLEDDKKERFLKAYAHGEIEMPIVMVDPDGKLELIAGNTRLTGMLGKQDSTQVWLISARHLKEITTSNEGMDVGSSDWFRFMMNRFT